jgi:hypothetical protein
LIVTNGVLERRLIGGGGLLKRERQGGLLQRGGIIREKEGLIRERGELIREQMERAY